MRRAGTVTGTASLFLPGLDFAPSTSPPAPAPATRSIPDLASYDIVEMSSSGGKDSLATMAVVARLLRQAGLLDRGVVVHADLGRVEWPGTPDLVAAQAAHFGLRFVKVRRAAGDLLEHVEAYGKWPTPTTRYCTADAKRGPIYTAFTTLAAEVRAAREIDGPVRILNCVGLRSEESPGRRRRPNLSRDPRPSGKGTVKIVDTWLPVQHLTEAEVWSICRASGAPIHPAYAAGFPRASCVFCIYAPEDALRLAGLLHPELLEEYVRVERKIGHDFKHHLPLAKVRPARVPAQPSRVGACRPLAHRPAKPCGANCSPAHLVRQITSCACESGLHGRPACITVAFVDVVGTDGIVGLIALFIAEQAAPTIGEPDPVVAAFEREIFGTGGPVSVAQPTTRTDALLATGKHFGVEVSRHPETDELITERHVFYRGVKGKQREYEDVSLILALCKWLLAYGGAAGSDEQIVEFARRVWIRTEGLEA